MRKKEIERKREKEEERRKSVLKHWTPIDLQSSQRDERLSILRIIT